MSTEPNPVSQLGKPPESGGAAQENGDGAAATTSSPEPNSDLDSRSSGKDAQDVEPVQPEDPMRWLIEHWKGKGWDYDEKSGDVWLELDEGGIHIAVIKGGSVTFKSDAVNGFYEGDRFPVAQVARRLSGGKVGAVKAIEVKAEPIMAKPLRL
jgi:hypothetical protein